MEKNVGRLNFIGCSDSEELAEKTRQKLYISRFLAIQLGEEAVNISQKGFYLSETGKHIDFSKEMAEALAKKKSLPPEHRLPEAKGRNYATTTIEIRNESSLDAARMLLKEGEKPLLMNFANGVQPGGGFLMGALAQEETLCRSSALYLTLMDDPMYDYHRKRPLPDSSDWAILSPQVPVFRTENGRFLDDYYLMSFLTCAAPYAPRVGLEKSGELLEKRILRILSIAKAYGYTALVLGAWGCGAFGNDPLRTARDFKKALTGPFAGAFAKIIFAIADWSPDRRYLQPFCQIFGDY